MPTIRHLPRNNLPGLQIMRGLAALAVLVHHVLEESQPLFNGHLPRSLVLFGASGVDVFFVLSGFIMYYTNQDQFGRKGAASRFLTRRVTRIVPLYWLCTGAFVLAHAAGVFAMKQISEASLLASLFFLPNHDIVLGVGWTLNYEMYFYLVMTISLLSRSERVGIPGILVSIPMIMAASLVLPSGETRTFLANPIVLEFCFGFAMAVGFTRAQRPISLGLPALLLGLAGLLAASAWAPSIGTSGLTVPVRFLCWGLPAAFLLFCALTLQAVTGRMARALLLVGDASYSIYLSHGFVMVTYARLLKTHAAPGILPLLWILLAVASALCVGISCYLFIERPMAEWLKVRSRRMTRLARASEATQFRV